MGAAAIGICAAIERASWGAWSGEEVTMAPRAYAAAVQRAGALALLLAPDEAVVADPDPLLDRIDALLLGGRRRYRPGDLRRRRAPRDEGDLARARSLRARARRARAGAGPAGAGDLPRHAAPQYRPWRDPGPAPAGASRAREATAPRRQLRRARGPPRGRNAGLRSGRRRAADGQVPPPPGGRASSARACSRAAGSSATSCSRRSSCPTVASPSASIWHPEEDRTSEVIPALVAAARSAHLSRSRRR